MFGSRQQERRCRPASCLPSDDGACDMDIRGVVYLVRAQRSDNGWIHYRTCDLNEAQNVARAFGAAVTIAAQS